MRMNLKVPFAEKDQAKKLGARWDAARKLWYVDGPDELAPFARWTPTPHDGAPAPAAAPKAGAAPGKGAAAKKQQASSQLIVGSRYVPQPRLCECLPWEDCAKCRRAGAEA